MVVDLKEGDFQSSTYITENHNPLGLKQRLKDVLGFLSRRYKGISKHKWLSKALLMVKLELWEIYFLVLWPILYNNVVNLLRSLTEYTLV